MSTTAPWLALAADLDHAEMFEGIELEMHPCYILRDSVRLAWVFLLCEAKLRGRAGRVEVKPARFARDYRLAGGKQAVEQMLRLAQEHGRIEHDGDGAVHLLRWREYQDKAYKRGTNGASTKPADAGKSGELPQTAKNSTTQHPAPRIPSTTHTQDPGPSTARTVSVETTSSASTGGVGGAARNDSDLDPACCACSPSESTPAWAASEEAYERRLVRALQLVETSPVSGRGKQRVNGAVQVIARDRDPVPLVAGIIKRSKRPSVSNAGGYIAQTIIDEAGGCAALPTSKVEVVAGIIERRRARQGATS